MLIGQAERQTQQRGIQIFQKTLGYRYLGHRQDRPDNRNIETELPEAFLTEQGHFVALIQRTLHLLNRAANDQTQGLYACNKAVYGLLRYGVPVKADAGQQTQTVFLVIFDAGTKKTSRPNQYFEVKAAQSHLQHQQGDIIRHTQGSGKGLTTVWFAKWIREHMSDARFLIITEMQKAPPADFSPKGRFVVFVGECHRTRSGELHKAMKAILPHATFIAFTGTPLLKADKQKSVEIFGGYIHTYKFNEAVRDGVVLDLRYEARNIDQVLTSPGRIDQWFAGKTRGLADIASVKEQRDY